ncbi:MAG: hypothetical protein PHQ40_00515 [Anaerolineaceae bacterium]|nr:hypothetical protein [Anaerolineaceae bacterium]MDD5367539.1 hypothetical protein [Anaerolineaceae bacterium]
MANVKKNNPKVEDVYRFLVQQWTTERIMPSCREIGNVCGIPSTSTVSYYLDKLIADGRISRDSRSRSIVLVGSVGVAPKGQQPK